ACSANLGAIAASEPPRWRRHWRGLCGVFAFLAVDELAQIHEGLTGPVRTLLHTSGALFFAWVVPYLGVVIVLSLVYLRFWLAMPARLRALTAIAAVLYVGGALGMEMVDGLYLEAHQQKANLTYGLLTTCEETLEMLGASLFLVALLEHRAID